MIIFLYGPDDYRRAKEKRAVVEKFLKKYSPLGMGFFDCAVEGSTEALKTFSRNISLFDAQRLAIVESAGEAPAEEFLAWLQSMREVSGITILLSAREAPKKEFAFLTKAPVVAQKFPLLTGNEWEKFAIAEARDCGVALAADAARFLAQAYVGDGWRLWTELQRISALGRAKIERSDLAALGIEIRPEFFARARQFGYGNRTARLAALEELFLARDPAAKIFNILSALMPARIAQFAAYDVAVKSGKMDYEEALADIALS